MRDPPSLPLLPAPPPAPAVREYVAVHQNPLPATHPPPPAPAPAGDVREYVAVYKNPPYPIFYDVVYHSYALVPMLASDLYYHSKFSSTVLTSLITGACMPGVEWAVGF